MGIEKTFKKDVDLENVISKKVKPMLDKAMKEYLGITVNEIEADISDKLLKSPLLDVEINTSIPFKKAKEKFKQTYLLKLLKHKYGNVSMVADIADVDRRSVHRLVKKFGIDVHAMRKEMTKSTYLKEVRVTDVIENTLDSYKQVINPTRMESFYKNVPELSKNITKALPDNYLTLKEAEEEFEKQYVLRALEESGGNISKAARAVGLRYETMHRKMKQLGISTK
ncbi:MAG: helix-turn-helix domain-containing protein [Candidatus Nanoarchaeia archaeon]